MEWSIEFHPQFAEWLQALDLEEQKSVERVKSEKERELKENEKSK